MFIGTSRRHMNKSEIKAFRHDAGILAAVFGASLTDLSYRDAYDSAHQRLHIDNSRSNVGYITTVVAREHTSVNPCKAFMERQVQQWMDDPDPDVSLPHLPHDERVVELSRRALGCYCDIHPFLRISGRDRRHLRKKGYLDAPALDRIALRITNYAASTHPARSRYDCAEDQSWDASDTSLNRTKLSRNPIHRDQYDDFLENARGHFMDFSLPAEDGSDASTLYRLYPSRRIRDSKIYEPRERPGLELVRHERPLVEKIQSSKDGVNVDPSSDFSFPSIDNPESFTPSFHSTGTCQCSLSSDGNVEAHAHSSLCSFCPPLNGDSSNDNIPFPSASASLNPNTLVVTRPSECLDSIINPAADGVSHSLRSSHPFYNPDPIVTVPRPSQIVLSQSNFPELEYLGDIAECVDDNDDPLYDGDITK